ncbi:MAG: HD domain-containing phosphohydrolase [Chloroflexota bacterium]
MVLSQKGRILIVDDEEIVRWALNKRLSKNGYHCQEAENADLALEQLKIDPSELVVLDINMPGKPGTELLPEIRDRFPETAVVMASAVTNTSIITQCIRDGAQDYICKPLNLDEVLQSIGRALEKKRLELQIHKSRQDLQPDVEENVGLRRIFLSAIESLIGTLESNDKYTAGHSRRVTEIALSIGQQLNLAVDELDDLRWGALLHDVGKIAVDPRILNKPGKLTQEEYRHIMTHAIVGPSIVKPLVNNRVVEVILFHHDHYDGTGLDQTLAGEDIPLGARIVAVADAFDAMTSDRPYRAAMSRQEALNELGRCSAIQFDPMVTGILLRIARDSNGLAQPESLAGSAA